MKKGYFVHIPKTAGSSIKEALPDKCLIKINREGMLKYVQQNLPGDRQVGSVESYCPPQWWVSAYGPGGNQKHLSPNFPFFNFLVDKSEYTQAFKFSFVRNPYDRIVSSYVYQKESILNFYIECETKQKRFPYEATLYPEFENVKCLADLEELYDFDYFMSYIKRIFDYNQIMADDSHYLPQIHFTHKPVSQTYFVKTLDFIGRFENLKEDYAKVCKFLDVQPKNLPHLKKGNRKHYKDYYSDETKALVTELYKDDIINFGYKF